MARVLVVEDNIDLAKVIRSLFEFENYQVDVFHDGNAGLHSILVNPYDIVILDWDLPGKSGLHILSEFRARGARTPVIMLTGKDAIEDKEAGLDGGADDYLTKPFNLKELGARTRALLRRASETTTNQVRSFDITLDPINQRATKEGRTHALSAQEFQLLDLALNYPHLQPSQDDLLQAVWLDETDRGEQRLAMAIRRLRKKFDPAGLRIFPKLFIAGESPLTDEIGSESISDELIGTVFDGKYELLERIGGGGTGAVYKCKHTLLGSEAALKLLHGEILSNPEMTLRFQREAQIIALLTHRNIVAIRDFAFTNARQSYLVMELLKGSTLSALLERRDGLSLPEVIEIFCQVCSGLAYAHAKGLIHRDIKPSNLMLVQEGADRVVKIVDFGLARATAAGPELAKITQTGHVIGSPPYMSPEQCRGEAADIHSDIYSVGCSMFETLSGAPPFCGNNPVDVFIKHITEKAPELFPKASTPMQIELNSIVAKCMAKEKERRYQSALELQDALTELLRDHQ